MYQKQIKYEDLNDIVDSGTCRIARNIKKRNFVDDGRKIKMKIPKISEELKAIAAKFKRNKKMLNQKLERTFS